MGISEEMYKNALNEMKVANETIAKCNKEGKPITLTDVKPVVPDMSFPPLGVPADLHSAVKN